MKYSILIGSMILIAACNSGDKRMKSVDMAHTDTTMTSDYTMSFDFNPGNSIAGKTTTIILKPLKAGTDSAATLEIQHEKKIHFIIVTSDLAEFKHLHPIEQADGTYKIDVTFQHGGSYLLYADYKPINSEKQVAMQEINVQGDNATQVIYKDQLLESKTGGYIVKLKTSESIVSNKELMFIAEISKAGKTIPPDSLENYLGEKAHMVIIGVTNRKYLHVHPMVVGNELMLHTSFPEAGMYRAWLEFQKNGIVQVADFVINVGMGKNEPTKEEHKH